MQCRLSNSITPAKRGVIVLAAVLLAASCAKPEVPTGPPFAPSVVAPSAPAPKAADRVYRETGVTSWYGRDFHGRKTASGETFDMYGMSAAHRTLPLGASIRVTNLDNFKSIKITVNDRGPFAGNRLLELSYGAARELGFAEQGTAKVKIEALEPHLDPATYTVQAAVFTEEENARLLKERLSRRYEVITIVPFESNQGRFYRVRVGSYGTEEKAELIAGKLTLEGLEPLVVRKD